jgi:TnpA family transposase
MHYSVSSIATYIDSHSHSCSTFDLYQLVHLQRARCEKDRLDRVLYRVHVTNYFHSQHLIFGHMPLYIAISVKSYNLLTRLLHIYSYQNKTITSSRI